MDFDVEADLSAAGRTDDLTDTLDYGALVLAAQHVITDERHDLLERVAQRIADALLAEPRALAVTVTVRKLRPPVPADVATAAVTIRRLRA